MDRMFSIRAGIEVCGKLSRRRAGDPCTRVQGLLWILLMPQAYMYLHLCHSSCLCGEMLCYCISHDFYYYLGTAEVNHVFFHLG